MLGHIYIYNDILIKDRPSFLQTMSLQSLLTVLNSTKSTEIPAVIKSLSMDSQDTLMKYLYKGMAMSGWADSNASVLLSWHEKVICCYGYYASIKA